jgi:hypothetical protein
VSPPASRSPAGPDGVRRIRFSGHEWLVKAAAEHPVGPGPNYFGDGPDSVQVDAAGRLHLRLHFKHGRWWAAEVISARSFGYGTYRFHLEADLDRLDPNVVLGLFTWSDDPAFAHREIDIELGRWGQESGDLGQCVVQPYERPGNIVRFAVPGGVRHSIHSFRWLPDRVTCEALSRSEAQVRSHTTIYRHSFTAGIPVPGGENARMNLWLVGGQPPRHGQDVEVVVSRFEFRPP